MPKQATNRLASCSSPYLRQHRHNPVAWYPWSSEAFAQAQREDKPIFLSVGYSACHWCHVMERESFENEHIAGILNEHFVSIKVDREERPDVDQIYMQAVQMLTGSGGWPMSVFMTHDARPFFGGTYWPPDNRWGRPGFEQVLLAVVDAWQNKREQIQEQSQQIRQHLQAACQGPRPLQGPLIADWIQAADAWLLEHVDSQHGGFGGAPKFPHAMDLSLQIELSALQPLAARTQAIALTLDNMARGGIYDHLGGGFARYSVDERWLVPHFEKMLYDNALLAATYADAYRLWGTPDYAQVVRETLDYALRDMGDPSGGFYSAEDADSEGVEGKFYVWSRSEIESLLGAARADRFCRCYDVSSGGNFEGSNILNLPQSIARFADEQQLDEALLRQQLAEDRAVLLTQRAKRVRPGRDDKVLLGWNALMITALTRGYRALGELKYLHAAGRCVEFVVTHMRREDGRLWHTWREGQASLEAYLDDYGALVDALCELFQVDSRAETLALAIDLGETMLQLFADPQGGFYFTAHDHEPLIARSKDLVDSSVPSGNALAAAALLSLARLTGRSDFEAAAESALIAASGVMSSSPQAAGQSLRVLNRFLNPAQEWVLLAGEDVEDFQAAQRALHRKLAPQVVTLSLASEAAVAELQDMCPLVEGRRVLQEQVTLYVCHNFTCQQPLSGREAVLAAL
ncbi:MAG: thioredoxin domain-containing protein [Planctomycetales bacterium]|nr:thioredoxin domain-containing protein [Planctomycetales bacterium]